MNIVPIRLEPHSRVLISGCGGGFDFLCGLPLGLELEASGHRVVYSNYSFSSILYRLRDEELGEHFYRVNRHSLENRDRFDYFPERLFCDWYYANYQRENVVYCYRYQGILDLRDIFNYIQEHEHIDYHFVIDGGFDGLMRGNEDRIGSPVEDSISILAAEQSGIPHRYYVASAWGIDGVSENDCLNNISLLASQRALCGVGSYSSNREACGALQECFSYIMEHMDFRPSIIVSSILASIRGAFGHHYFNENMELMDSPVWISPLVQVLWYFNLDSVARNRIYYLAACEMNNLAEIQALIRDYWEESNQSQRYLDDPYHPRW